MKISNVPFVFALVAVGVSLAAVGILYVFFGPGGGNLEVAGIVAPVHLLLFPAVSGLTAWAMAIKLFSPNARLTGATGFLRGIAVGAVAFIASILIHAIVVSVVADIATAFWLFMAMLLFGGVAFGLPGMVISGVAGLLCTRRLSAR